MKNYRNPKMDSALRQQGRKFQEYPLFGVGPTGRLDCAQILGLLILCGLKEWSPEQQSCDFSADSLYHHLNNKVTLQKVEAMLNSFIKRRDVGLLHRRRPWRRLAIAIDFTNEMYYGQKPNEGVVGTKHEAGSNWAYRFLCVSIVVDGCRFMLWAAPMLDRHQMPELLEMALKSVRRLGLHPERVLLDREFSTADTLLIMEENNFQYIIPATQHEKFNDAIKGLELPARIGWTVGDMQTQLVVLEEKKKKYGYITNIPKTEFTEDAYVLSEFYSERWGIETSFRCGHDFRISTSSKKLEVRYLYFCISLLLYNLWVWINLFLGLPISSPMHLTLDRLKEKLKLLLDDHHSLKTDQGWFLRCLNRMGPERLISPCRPAGRRRDETQRWSSGRR